MTTMDFDSKALLSALSSLQGRAGFSSVGASPFFFPGLILEELGEIAFPFSKEQAAAFIELAEAAPYGKGTKTEYDETVRKCWQIDSKNFTFKSPSWEPFLAATLEKVREDLGIPGRISAQPYKLLLYGPGGHFKAHRDSEKLDAMFGTLIIALPSQHDGGKLHIRHRGVETTVDFSAEARRHDFQHAAFFADCEHEVVPVTSGYRFCAVYNLVLEEGKPELLNPCADDHAGPLATLLEKVTGSRAPGAPTVILLEHHYTEANFSLARLKGHDRQRAAALFAAAGHAGLTARLALATLYQMGELEGEPTYGSRYRSNSRASEDPDGGTMGEIYDESFELDHWRDGRDRVLALGRFPVELDEVITAENFSAIDPDEKAGEGFTGNAGCTMEYWYRRAAVVLWPEGCDEEILCAKNLPEACAQLVSLSSGKKTGNGTPFDKLARAAISALSVATESGKLHFSGIDKELKLPFPRVLQALSQAKRRDLLDELLRTMPGWMLAVCPQSLWENLFAAFEPDAFAAVFEEMLAEADRNREPLFSILAALNGHRKATVWPSRIAPKLSQLKLAKMPSWQAAESRDPTPPGKLDESRTLFAASLSLSNQTDIAAAIDFLKSDGSLSAVRKLIGPLFTDKGAVTKRRLAKSPVAMNLLEFCKDSLSKEIARPLFPYPDWCRPCPPVPKNQDASSHSRRNEIPVCQEIATFMADPAAREHPIRRRQDERVSAEEFIKRHFLDLDYETIRKGTPHTLHCTKNDRSYQHELELRKIDEAMRHKLEVW